MDDSERRIMIAKLRQDEQRREEGERLRKETERLQEHIERRRKEEAERLRKEQEQRRENEERFREDMNRYREKEEERMRQRSAGIRRHNTDPTHQSYAAYGTSRGYGYDYGTGPSYARSSPRDFQGQGAELQRRRPETEQRDVETKSFWGKMISKLMG
jgi:hypothetical protein